MVNLITKTKIGENGSTIFSIEMDSTYPDLQAAMINAYNKWVRDNISRLNMEIDTTCTPEVEYDTLRKNASTPIRYVCNKCGCRLDDAGDEFYVHCPRCGRKIDYSNHIFLKENKDVIR